MAETLFEIATPLSFVVRCSIGYWELISELKHPILTGQADRVKETLSNPDHVVRSRRDPDVYLFYRREEAHWICALVRREDGTGFLITAYPADKIKIGEQVWTRSN